jgi:hypothetical protein
LNISQFSTEGNQSNNNNNGSITQISGDAASLKATKEKQIKEVIDNWINNPAQCIQQFEAKASGKTSVFLEQLA